MLSIIKFDCSLVFCSDFKGIVKEYFFKTCFISNSVNRFQVKETKESSNLDSSLNSLMDFLVPPENKIFQIQNFRLLCVTKSQN
jgi:uncharacterized membrane protein